MLFAAGQGLDQGQGVGGLAPGPVGDHLAGVWGAPLGREGGDLYEFDQRGGRNGLCGELHGHSLPARPADTYGVSWEATRRSRAWGAERPSRPTPMLTSQLS